MIQSLTTTVKGKKWITVNPASGKAVELRVIDDTSRVETFQGAMSLCENATASHPGFSKTKKVCC